MNTPPALAVIACAVLEAEVRHFAVGLSHIRRLVILRQGLHNEPMRLQRELQASVSAAEQDPAIEAIALVYGMCSRGVENLRHDRCPIVLPRAHDCVTIFLGDKERYADYLRRHPGTYWYSPGWIATATPPGPDRDARLRREFSEKFGPEEVDYLMEMEGQWIANYSRATYVGLGVGETAADVAYTRHCAQCLGWEFDQIAGDPSLLQDLLGGRWDEKRFLIAPPGFGVQVTADDTVMRAVRLPADGTAPDLPGEGRP